MNCVGVTCLKVLCPSGRLKSCPPNLAEAIRQVPRSLFSAGFAALSSSAQTAAAQAPSPTIATRHRPHLLNDSIIECSPVVNPTRDANLLLDTDWQST